MSQSFRNLAEQDRKKGKRCSYSSHMMSIQKIQRAAAVCGKWQNAVSLTASACRIPYLNACWIMLNIMEP